MIRRFQQLLILDLEFYQDKYKTKRIKEIIKFWIIALIGISPIGLKKLLIQKDKIFKSNKKITRVKSMNWTGLWTNNNNFYQILQFKTYFE